MPRFSEDIDAINRRPTNLIESGLNLAKRGESFTTSVGESYDTMIGAVSGGAQQWLAGHLDKMMFNESDYKVDEEELERLRRLGIHIPEGREFTRSQLQLLTDRAYREAGRRTKINSKFAGTNFVGSMLPELINPVNVVPFGRGVSAIGRGFGRAGTVSKQMQFAAEGRKLRAGFESFKDVSIDALAGNIAIEPAYYMDARFTGKEYTPTDSLYNVGFGTAIGGGFFGSITAGLSMREVGRFQKSAQMFEDLYTFMETGDLGKSVNILYQNSKGFRKAIDKEKMFADNVREAYDSDGILRFEDLSDEQTHRLLSITENYYQKSLQDALTRAMTKRILENHAKEEKSLSIAEYSKKYRESFLNVYEAVDRNSRELFNRLTDEEKKLATEIVNGLDNFFFRDDASGFEVEGEARPWFDPQTGEAMPDLESEAPSTGKSFINHSGGARGSDSAWGRVGSEYGVQSNHYFVEGNKTPEGNVPITREQALQADEALKKANKTLGRTFPTRNEYVNNLLRRNYSQVVNSDAVFAVTEIEGGIPQGGTGWAVQMAIDMGKPVYVYSQSKNSWMTLKEGKWVVTETPTLTENFAGIGTRDLTEGGLQAIRDVYKKTFKSGAPEQYTSARYSKNGYEVSSAGDTRFSAFRARLKDGRTIEQAYQEAKGSGKGQPAKDPDFDYYGTYKALWAQWAKENPELMQDLAEKARGKVLTDKFANTENNQARALAELLNENVYLRSETPDVSVSYEAGVGGVRRAEAEGKGVNVLRKAGEQHYGNPFSHLPNARDAVRTGSLEETVEAYRAWLEGTDHTDVKQERRQWVLNQIDSGALDGKKLLYYSKQTPNHAEVLAEFIRKRRGAKTASESSKRPISFRKSIQSLRDAQKAARWMYALREQNRVDAVNPIDGKPINRLPTTNELIEKGVITRKQAEKYLRRFEKHYGVAYRKQIETAHRVVNNIFGIQVDLKLEEGLSSKGILLGMQRMRDPENTIRLARMDNFPLMHQDPFTVMVHEMVHALERYDPKSYNAIRKAIADNPLLEQEMIDLVEARGYKDAVAIEDELPSILLEWAITRRNFWKSLMDDDPSVFKKLKKAIVELVQNTIRLRKDVIDDVGALFDPKNLKDLLESDTPETFAAKIGAIVAEARKRSHGNVIEAIDAVRASADNVTKITDTPLPRPVQDKFLNENEFESLSHANAVLAREYRDGFKELTAIVFRISDKQNVELLLEAFTDILLSKEDFELYIKKILGEETPVSPAVLDTLYTLNRKLSEDYTFTQQGALDKIIDSELKRNLSRVKGATDHDVFTLRMEETTNFYLNKMMAVFNDEVIETNIRQRLDEFDTDRKKIEFLRTYLDGQERKGMEGEYGLENKIISASQEAAMPLLDVLMQYDLVELFMPDGSISFFKYFRNKNKVAKWRMFGKNAKKASAQFHKELHQALIDRKLPDGWEKYEGLRALFDVLQATEFKLLKDMNRAGIRIGMLEDFGGVSQKWDVDIIKGMSRQQFVADLLPKLDIEKTKQTLGVLAVDKDGNDLFNPQKFLADWYDELVSEQRVSDDVQVLDLDSLFTSRMVRIKPEFAVDVAAQYSGYDSIGHLIIQQIQRRSAIATMAQNAGLQPNKLLKGLADGIGGKGGNTYTNKGAYIATVNKLTGILENPVDIQVSKIGDFIQKYSNIIMLSGSGMSSLTDIPLVASTLEMQGVKFTDTHRQFLNSWQESMKRKFSNPQEMRAYFLSMGAGFDILNNAVVRRLSDATGQKGFIDVLNNLMFKVNGLNAFTATHQEMYVDLLTRALAGDISPEFKSNLLENGFTEAEIKHMQSKASVAPDGARRVDPRNLNKKTASKLRLYMTKYMRQAVIVPDVGTKAQFTMGFRKGTIEGESARVLTQYQPFMMAMSKLLYRRFKNGSFGKTKNNAMLYKMAHLVTYIGAAMAFAYMVTVLKDLARGKKPKMLHELTPFDKKRIVGQSGILGYLQVPIDASQGGIGSAVAPFPSTLFGLAWDTGSGDVEGALDQIKTFAGGDIHGVQMVYGLIGHTMAETLNEIGVNELDVLND